MKLTTRDINFGGPQVSLDLTQQVLSAPVQVGFSAEQRIKAERVS